MAQAKKGRPTKYTKEIAQEIIRRMCEGESLNAICLDESIPSKGTVLGWVFDGRDGFSDQYEKAMSIRAHGWAEEIIGIADDENAEAARSRLMVDSRKWLVSKLIPKFSDKTIDIFDDSTEVTAVVIKRVDASDSKRK